VSAGAASAVPNYEQAGELKIGQVGIANLRVRTLDVDRLADEMRERVARAPKLFARAAVVLDFGGLAAMPDTETARALIEALHGAGVIPVALAYGTAENDALAAELGLPVLAKFRARYESDGNAAPPPAPPPPDASTAGAEPAKAAGKPSAAGQESPGLGSPGLIQAAPVRSGQQVYAANRDLTVLSSVGAGAEAIADGSIHIYGPLRGRALAGALGNESARIFCREFHAELVAVAGHYKVLEDVPAELRGKPVQVWLEKDELKMAVLE
jgi:septum site-determining protein MinC